MSSQCRFLWWNWVNGVNKPFHNVWRTGMLCCSLILGHSIGDFAKMSSTALTRFRGTNFGLGRPGRQGRWKKKSGRMRLKWDWHVGTRPAGRRAIHGDTADHLSSTTISWNPVNEAGSNTKLSGYEKTMPSRPDFWTRDHRRQEAWEQLTRQP